MIRQEGTTPGGGSGPFDESLDRICLSGVRGRGFHGVLAHERETGQEFVVDAVLGVSCILEAARTDDLTRTVDYGALAQAIVEVIEGPARNLVESVAAEIADRCLGFELVRAVQVTVHKPQAPIPVPFDDVAVRITRVRCDD